jgi:hypothetical protein
MVPKRANISSVAEEEVAGTFLSQALVAGEPLPWPEALRVVASLGRALEELHAAGLVHGAVRPGNIVLLGPGTARLADGSLSRSAPAGAEEAVATPLYSSPERAVGERGGASSDIFALGAVAYRLLTGRDAFEADTPGKILARVIHDRPRRASTIVLGLPPGADEVLWKALAKPRKERYATAGLFREDVEDLLAGRSPRHATAQGSRVDTSRFLAAAGSDGGPGEATGTGTGSHRVDRRRPVVRALVGLLALTLVGGLELLRREIEGPERTPAGPPSAEPVRRGGETSREDVVADLPSIADPAPLARLSLDFRHTLEKGTLVLSLDGGTILESRVSGAVTRKFLGIKLREGRLRQVIAVSPGRHQIRLSVRWSDDERSETITGDFTAGATRKLYARLGRIGKPLSVEWQ